MDRTLSNTGPGPLRSWPLWLAGILFLAAVLNWPGMSSPILLDDDDGLKHVAKFASWQNVFGPDSFGLFRPLKNAIFYWFNQQEEISLGLWHGMVLACFLASIAAVFSLGRMVTKSDAFGLVVAAVWALTPTQTSTAIWMSCINISVSIVFLAGFLIAHARSLASGRPAPVIAAATLLLFLSQSAYETSVSAVALAFIFDALATDTPTWKKRFARYIPYIAATFVFLVVRHLCGSTSSSDGKNYGFGPDTEPWMLVVSAPWFLYRHLTMWLAPLGRIEFVSTYLWGRSTAMWELAMAWVVMLAVCYGAWRIRKRVPLASFGIFWFFLTALPSSNLLPIYAGPIEDYYLTVPSIGLAIAFAAIMARAISALADSGGRRIPIAVGLGSLAVWRLLLIPFCFTQAKLWENPVLLYLSCIETRPLQFQAESLAARELMLAGQTEEALVLASRSAETGPWHPLSHMVRGMTLSQTGEPDAAVASFRETLKLSQPSTPIHQFSMLQIATIHTFQTQRWDDARAALLPLLDYGEREYRIPAIHAMSTVYEAQDNIERAIATLVRGQSIYPDEPSFQEHIDALRAKPAKPPVETSSTDSIR